MKRFALPPALGLLAAVALAAPLAAQTTHTVTVTNIEFTPSTLTVEQGDTVIWENVEGFHNVNGTTVDYPDNPEGFGNDVAGAPWTYEFTFDVVGEYDYHCDVHGSPLGGMRGSVTVVETSPPAVTADIEPVDPPVVVPPEGGPVAYRVTLTNTTAATVTVDAWIMATLPNGSPFGPIRGPQPVTLQAGQSVGPIRFTDRVPGAAPAGEYSVTLNVGNYPSVVEASDSFHFTKIRFAAAAPPFEGAALVAVDGAFPEAAVQTAAPASVASAHPNPAHGRTTIPYTLDANAVVHLALYDALGREVAVLVDGPVEAGTHEATLDDPSLPPGVYVWRLVVGDAVRTGQVTLVE